MADIRTMTADEIRARLDEIGRLERAHAARNMDAELAEVMRAGGDVDALEEKHLQAERTARRLRVERAALEAEMPAAKVRAGTAALAEIKVRHDQAAQEMDSTIGHLASSWTNFKTAFAAFRMLQDEAFEMTDKAARLSVETGAPMLKLGNFKSSRIEAICADLQRIPVLGVLATVGTEASAGNATQSRVLD